MRKQVLTIAVVLSGGPALSQDGHAEKMKEGTALFQKTIRPALIDNCLKCHGDEKVRSGLDLSTRDLLLEGGDSEDAIDLEKPGESYLLTLIRHEEEDLEMPPKKDKLPDSLIADFEKWIALGAPYDKPLLERKGERPAEMRVTDSDREFWSFKAFTHQCRYFCICGKCHVCWIWHHCGHFNHQQLYREIPIVHLQENHGQER